MKKYLVLLVLALSLCLWINTRGDYGEFGTGTTSRDTVPISIETWDSLGFAAPADTLWIWRYVSGTSLVDSTIDTSLGNAGSGSYIWKRRAFDGTNYGSYRVKFKFRPFGQGNKYYTQDKFYTVTDYVDSIDVRRWVLDPDSSKYGGWGRNIDRVNNAGTVLALANNVITAASIATGAFVAAKYAADYWALANWTGTWTQAQYSQAFWHNVAVYADSTEIAVMARLLGGKGSRMLDYYNASGKLDSVRYYENATLLSRLIFYRPTATSAPDSMRMYSY